MLFNFKLIIGFIHVLSMSPEDYSCYAWGYQACPWYVDIRIFTLLDFSVNLHIQYMYNVLVAMDSD